MEIIERPTDTLLTVTPTAAAKIRELMAGEPDGDTMVLRVAIRVAAAPASSTASGSTPRRPRETTSSSSRV
jgi:hypothetical protein